MLVRARNQSFWVFALVVFVALISPMALATEVPINGVLTSEPSSVNSKLFDGKLVDEAAITTNINGISYDIIVTNGRAVLIDPRSYNQLFGRSLIADLDSIASNMMVRNKRFSLVLDCPTLRGLFLYTLSSDQTLGLSNVSLIANLQITLRPENGSEIVVVLRSSDEDPSDQTAVEGKLLADSFASLPSPFLPRNHTFVAVTALSPSTWSSLQLSAFEFLWKLKANLNSEYQQKLDVLMSRLLRLGQTSLFADESVGRKLRDLPSETLDSISLAIASQNANSPGFLDYEIVKLDRTLSLVGFVKSRNGTSQKNIFKIPYRLP